VDAVVEGNRYVSALADFPLGRGGCLRGWARCLPGVSLPAPAACCRASRARVRFCANGRVARR